MVSMMSQIMFNDTQSYTGIPDSALSEYFRNAGDMLAEESAVLGGVIRDILATGGVLTNKAIILSLIHVIEHTDDVVKSDIVRKTLEIVVDHTMDDI